MSSEPEFADGRTLVQDVIPRYRPKRADVILVIDDSPSMRPFSEAMARNLRDLAEVTRGHTEFLDLRLAVTTTSVADPACTGSRALGGEPIMTSCRSHLGDFVGPDEHPELGGEPADLRSICEVSCPLDSIPRVPSLGHDEHELEALELRPWLEPPHNPFGGNLDQVDFADALVCAGLQGFAGCSYESPIEAAARMVEHLSDPQHPLAEFRRADARLAIVIITDEDDCSRPASSATIFDPDGARVFWSNPNAAAPTSAACINAGLECDSEACTLTDHDLDGDSTQAPSSTVLTSPDRLQQALAAAGEYADPAIDEPLISMVAGFTNVGGLHYTPPNPDLSEPEQLYLDRFGVVPGCAEPSGAPVLRAGPAGRLAAAAGASDERYSICEWDWTPMLQGLATRIEDILYVPCMEFACVADLEPSTALLEPDCVVEEVDYQQRRIPIPLCLRDESGWVLDPETESVIVPDGAESCWFWRTDASDLSSDRVDDISDMCSDADSPAEFWLVRRPGSFLAYDSIHQLRCRPC